MAEEHEDTNIESRRLTDAQFVEKMFPLVIGQAESMVLAIPTGPKRNALCDALILLKEAQACQST